MDEPRHARRLVILVASIVPFAIGCASRGEPVDAIRAELAALCEAMVAGTGAVDVETDYIPHVVQCENGSADFEALAAQAIAARSVLYYKMQRYGSIGDGTGSQVYSCGRSPTEEHYRAARETAGRVLRYGGAQVFGFYVAGARQTPPGCTGSGDDPTGSEHYVTYNTGRSGSEVVQSPLGLVDPGNLSNRGCMSQNGSHCLATSGMAREHILRFYYGEDIEIERAEGGCVSVAVDDAGAPPADGGRSDAVVATPDAGDGDAGASSGDAVSGGGDSSSPPPSPTGGSPGRAIIHGSCAVHRALSSHDDPRSGLVLMFLLLCLVRRRGARRSGSHAQGP